VSVERSARLRIAFFNRSYHPDVAATGQLLTDLAEDLARAGHDVWVVAGPPLSTAGDARRSSALWPWRREMRRGVRILRAPGTAFRPARFAGRVANYVSYFLSSCLAALALPRVDVVVALTDPPIIGLAALAAVRRSRAAFVFFCQDVFPEVARLIGAAPRRRVERWLERITRHLARRADRVVAVGETMRERLIAHRGVDAAKVGVIHNWADCAAIAPGEKENPWSIAQGLADRFVVMHSGNVGLSQDLDVLLDAAARLAGAPDVVVVIVGDGVRRAALETRARALGLDNVRFLPFQPRERLTESFAAADVFVISLKAGLAGYIVPSKLYGILAAGRPYVAAVDAASEVATITRAQGSGLLVEPGDAADLARRLLALRDDPGLARQLGRNGRRAALCFDRPVQVQAWEGLLSEVAAAPRDAAARPPLLKRPFDVVLAALGLLASLPLWVVIAAAVKLEDGGPVFYGQERVGKGGRRFTSWKFRSMVADAEARVGAIQARENDPRVTRTGRLLRATAMDELPQLWNILIGDMSFVGPRALRPAEIEVMSDGAAVPIERVAGYEARHRVTPGLTGVAQIYAPRDLPRRQKFKLDLLYVRRQSVRLDVRLIALSFWITLRARWEHRGRKV